MFLKNAESGCSVFSLQKWQLCEVIYLLARLNHFTIYILQKSMLYIIITCYMSTLKINRFLKNVKTNVTLK